MKTVQQKLQKMSKSPFPVGFNQLIVLKFSTNWSISANESALFAACIWTNWNWRHHKSNISARTINVILCAGTCYNWSKNVSLFFWIYKNNTRGSLEGHLSLEPFFLSCRFLLILIPLTDCQCIYFNVSVENLLVDQENIPLVDHLQSAQ